MPCIFDQAKVVLEASGHHDPEALVELSTSSYSSGSVSNCGFTSGSAQPESVANELLVGDWEARWPKWPGWTGDRTATGRRGWNRPEPARCGAAYLDVSERPLLPRTVSAISQGGRGHPDT